MYKTRVQKWGLDKKTKEPEAWAILRIKMARDLVGKDSAFRVRGKPVTIDDVLRYFKRKGIANPDVGAQPHISTPPEIECWTPLLSPTPGFATSFVLGKEDPQRERDLVDARQGKTKVVCTMPVLDSVWDSNNIPGYLDVDQIQQILFANPEVQSFEVPYSPLPPQSLVMSEKLFASIKAYCGGIFDAGLFQTNDIEEDSEAVDEFNSMCYTGARLIDSLSFVEGGRCFSKASGLLGHLLQRDSPETLRTIYNIFVSLRQRGYNEIVTGLRNYASAITKIRFAEDHPWRQLFSQIGILEDSYVEIAIVEASRCTCDILSNRLGQFHKTALYAYLYHFNAVSRSNNSAQLLHNLLVQGEQELGKFDVRLQRVKYEYAHALYGQGQYEQANKVLEEVLFRSRVTGDPILEIASLKALAHSHDGMENQDEAESKLRQAIERNEEVYGEHDSHTLQLKVRLEQWVRKRGRAVEADELRIVIDKLIPLEDIQLEEMDLQQ
jgi:tetratricopeptide (TPR) repeat protein